MITEKQKEMLFKLWSNLGVSLQSPKYLDISFPNPQEFKYLVALFYGLKRDNPTNTLIALEQDIKQKSNEFLSLPENSPCGGKLRMVKNNALPLHRMGELHKEINLFHFKEHSHLKFLKILYVRTWRIILISMRYTKLNNASPTIVFVIV